MFHLLSIVVLPNSTSAKEKCKNKAAQNHWFNLRHGEDLISNQGQDSVIVIDDESVVSNAKQTNMWIPELGHSNHDRKVLLSNGWLTDSIVNAAQSLQRKSNPLISGLQDVSMDGWTNNDL